MLSSSRKGNERDEERGRGSSVNNCSKFRMKKIGNIQFFPIISHPKARDLPGPGRRLSGRWSGQGDQEQGSGGRIPGLNVSPATYFVTMTKLFKLFVPHNHVSK